MNLFKTKTTKEAEASLLALQEYYQKAERIPEEKKKLILDNLLRVSVFRVGWNKRQVMVLSNYPGTIIGKGGRYIGTLKGLLGSQVFGNKQIKINVIKPKK